MKELVAQENVKGIQDILAQNFEAVKREKLSWLNELQDTGYSGKEIAGLLVDTKVDTPWIFFDPDDTQDFSLDTELHAKACVLYALEALLERGANAGAQPRLELESSRDPRLHSHVKRSLDELCWSRSTFKR